LAAHQAGEEELGRVAAAQGGVFVLAAEDRLRLLEDLLVDERLVQARVSVAVPADEPPIGRASSYSNAIGGAANACSAGSARFARCYRRVFAFEA
jgi:hypothetical protein